MRKHVLRVLLTASAVMSFTQVASAGDITPQPTEKPKKVGIWFPPNDFYPLYVADPLRPQNALTIQWLPHTEIPETSAGRFGLRTGGSLGIYRWHPPGDPNRGWQLTFDGGMSAQFDIGHSWDNTGWDGFYGLTLAWKPTHTLGFRIGSQHDSSHIGDEYSDRTGRQRIHYTREEAILGVSWEFKPRWVLYSELGYGNGYAGSLTSTIQVGTQYNTKQTYWKNRASYFVAFNSRSYEESDWRTRLTIQTGLMIPVGNRSSVHRLAIEAGLGRSLLGQFAQYDESWVAIGWFYDF
jgi:hypothetical protein